MIKISATKNATKTRQTKQVLNKLGGSKSSRLGEKRTKAKATVETFTVSKINN